LPNQTDGYQDKGQIGTLTSD